MSLIRWREPGQELRRLKDDFSTLMGDFFGRPLLPTWLGREVSPGVDIYETDSEVVLKLEVPGIEKKDLDISITDTDLTVKGEVRKDEEVKEQNYYRRERRHGSFSRTIPLPGPVQTGAAKASFKDGVLEIRIPKTPEEQAKVKKVAID
jgi:HSP20 family protein